VRLCRDDDFVGNGFMLFQWFDGLMFFQVILIEDSNVFIAFSDTGLK